MDSAVDEGPSHEEVQVWWILEHLSGCTATLVTAGSSSSSYLNRVELQNGCLTTGHANLFTPLTLNGYPFVQGKVDEDIVKSNLINRVNKSPCGKAVIHLCSGSDSLQFQQYREHLKVCLKGSKAKRELLRTSEPPTSTTSSKQYGRFDPTIW